MQPARWVVMSLGLHRRPDDKTTFSSEDEARRWLRAEYVDKLGFKPSQIDFTKFIIKPAA
jgi:hypothetical protein